MKFPLKPNVAILNGESIFGDQFQLRNSGTSDGVRKAWLTRHAGGHGSQEYEGKEASMHHAKMSQLASAPLSERQVSQADALDHMKGNPEGFAEHASWILEGAYGRGAMKAAEQIMSMGARGNREAQLSQLVAAYDHGSPQNHTTAAWHKLSAPEKAALSKHMQKVIAHHDKHVLDNAAPVPAKSSLLLNTWSASQPVE